MKDGKEINYINIPCDEMKKVVKDQLMEVKRFGLVVMLINILKNQKRCFQIWI